MKKKHTKAKKLEFDWTVARKLLFMCLWVVVSILAVQFIVGFLMIRLLSRDIFAQPVWTAVYSAITYVLAMALIIWAPPAIIAKWRKNKKTKYVSRDDLGLRDWPTWTDVGLGPVGFIVATLLAALLVGLFTVFPWFNAEEAQNTGFTTFVVGADRIIAFLTLVVIAPIAEEIIFRGFLYGKIRQLLHDRISEKWGIAISILVVSALFGIIHMQWNVGVNVFALSVVLCALREITGTIYAGILTHMIKNGIAFYLLYVLGLGV